MSNQGGNGRDPHDPRVVDLREARKRRESAPRGGKVGRAGGASRSGGGYPDGGVKLTWKDYVKFVATLLLVAAMLHFCST